MATQLARQTVHGPGHGSGIGKFSLSTKRVLFGLPFYKLTLLGAPAHELNFSPSDPWQGLSTLGSDICRGEFHLAGKNLPLGEEPWFDKKLSEMAEVDLHGFAWLRDLHALGGNQARLRARQLIQSWIANFSHWDVLIWKADIIGARLAAWLNHYDFFGSSADSEFQRLFFQSCYKQARHLKRALHTTDVGSETITALKGLIYTALSLPQFEKNLHKSLSLLNKELHEQILEDGGHYQRCPSRHLSVFSDLIELRALLSSAKVSVPGGVDIAITKMAPVLKFFRHGDGKLAVFNSGFEEDDNLIDKVLLAANDKSRIPQQLKDMAFTRAVCGKTTIMMDAGAPNPAGGCANAGTLSFEMSHTKHRMIVNCGTYAGDVMEWIKAQRSTAAHSALTVDDTSSANITVDGQVRRAPKDVSLTRQDHDGQVLIEASHDGFQQLFRLTHTRRLFLSKNGEDIRGEDILSGEEGRVYAIRFHLHPRVKASLSQDRKHVLLKLPSGAGWIVSSNSPSLNLEDSIYMGKKGAMSKTLQVVLSGAISPKKTTVIKWALQYQSKK